MIDEELYQQAADELNSDRRKAHIWARACALASDDHDEARYLYTNLRVEELIADRKSGHSSTADLNSQLEEDDATLALEPLAFTGDKGEVQDGVFSPVDSNDLRLDEEDFIPESVPTPSGIDRQESPDDFLQLLADNEANENAIVSEHAGFEERIESHFEQQAQFSAKDQIDGLPADQDIGEYISADDKSLEDDFLDSYAEHQENIKAAARKETPEEFINNLDLNDSLHSGSDHDELELDFDSTTELNLNPGELTGISDSDQHVVSSVHGGELVDEETPMGDNNQRREDEGLTWLEDDTQTSKLPATQQEERFTPLDRENDLLAQELERQADQLPGQQNDVIEHTDLVDNAQEAAYAAHDETHPDTPDTQQDTGVRDRLVSQPYNLPVDLTLDGHGKEFAVYRRDAKSQAVNTGVSWSALFFTLPFLIYRHLFGTAIMYAVLWIIVLGGLLLTGLAWMDAGSTASILTKASTIGFALLAVIGLLYLPFRYGNTWRGEKLERRGFELVAWVRASNAGKAVGVARRAAALD